MSLQNFNSTLSKYTKTIDLKVKVRDVNRDFVLRLSEKSRIKEVGNRLAEMLSLDTLRTDFVFSNTLGLTGLNPSSTIYQNGLKQGDVLVAKIINTGYNEVKSNTFYKSTQRAKSLGGSRTRSFIEEPRSAGYQPKVPTEMIGLKCIGICNNKKCVTYGKKVTYPMNCGEFDLIALLSRTMCLRCKRPSEVNGISLTNCYWKLQGNFRDSTGFMNLKYMKNWVKTEGTDNTIIYDKLRETRYVNPKLMVKTF